MFSCLDVKSRILNFILICCGNNDFVSSIVIDEDDSVMKYGCSCCDGGGIVLWCKGVSI